MWLFLSKLSQYFYSRESNCFTQLNHLKIWMMLNYFSQENTISVVKKIFNCFVLYSWVLSQGLPWFCFQLSFLVGLRKLYLMPGIESSLKVQRKHFTPCIISPPLEHYKKRDYSLWRFNCFHQSKVILYRIIIKQIHEQSWSIYILSASLYI